MMNARKESRDAAVSPVVGVMLMLVVTIIIAALVSAFAGGLGTTEDATPMVTFTADLSVANGLTITCTGVSPGPNVDFDVVVGDTNYYKVGSGATQTFTPGVNLNIDSDALDDGFVAAFGSFSGYQGTGMYVPNSAFIGKTYTIQLIDKDSGIIGKAYAVLTA
ncbi:MAG: hypothetical protein A4E38_01014 [Methanoregulaceae archaeon PtaB.Bin108]|nr:MAG: hypothetical protein A4E38_01014 [Methanoregulaceae archaeon PtaB.Bin108]